MLEAEEERGARALLAELLLQVGEDGGGVGVPGGELGREQRGAALEGVHLDGRHVREVAVDGGHAGAFPERAVGDHRHGGRPPLHRLQQGAPAEAAPAHLLAAQALDGAQVLALGEGAVADLPHVIHPQQGDDARPQECLHPDGRDG